MTVVNYTIKCKNLYSKNWNKGVVFKYKVPKISNKTSKGQWLNSFVQKFFVVGNHDFKTSTALNYIKLKTTQFRIKNNKDALVNFFKGLKKLKQHHFDGEVFNVQLLTLKEAA
jgi:hypothetical protein